MTENWRNPAIEDKDLGRGLQNKIKYICTSTVSELSLGDGGLHSFPLAAKAKHSFNFKLEAYTVLSGRQESRVDREVHSGSFP